MSNFGKSLNIRDVVSRVPDGLDVNRFCSVVNEGGNLFWVLAGHELGVDAKSREEDFELVVRAAVQVGRRHDVVAMAS